MVTVVRSTPDRAVWFRALAVDIVLCSWARHFALTVPLYTQVYNGTSEFNAEGNPCDGLASHPGGVEILVHL